MARSVSNQRKHGQSIDQTWIASALAARAAAERAVAVEMRARAEAPPEPALAVLYHEIAEADERHAALFERIATRHGHVPGDQGGTGIGHALGQIKDQIAELGRTALDQVEHDLELKARSIGWCTAWVCAFEQAHDPESARELSGMLAEDRAHHEALQQNLNRLVASQAAGEGSPKSSRDRG